MKVNQEIFETNNLINNPDPFLNKLRTKPILKSNKNMIAVMKQHILPEHPQKNKIIEI